MKNFSTLWGRVLVTAVLALAGASTFAQEAVIRKNLGSRLPEFQKIDEVTKTEMPGIFEVRVDNDLFYTDASGSYLIQGHMIDVNQRRNVTAERMEKITAIAFDSLPTKDAFTIVRGNGKRKIAVFEDPNCGYCKRFERDLQNVDNVTIHMYLYPILGGDSPAKSRAVWCAKDRAATWQDLMVRDKPAPAADAKCDVDAIARNVELGRKLRITGTPTMFFVNGKRIPGAISIQQLEQALKENSPG